MGEMRPGGDVAMIFQRAGDVAVTAGVEKEGRRRAERLVRRPGTGYWGRFRHAHRPGGGSNGRITIPGAWAGTSSRSILPFQQALDVLVEAVRHGIVAQRPVPGLGQVRLAAHADMVFAENQPAAAHDTHPRQHQIGHRTENIAQPHPQYSSVNRHYLSLSFHHNSPSFPKTPFIQA